MTQYSFAATVKAMKIQEVILRAASGEILWIDAADIIGVSYRTMKRWKSNYEEFGYDGIFDRRMKSPSPKSAPLSEVQTILQLYRTHYKGFNATHFHEKLKEHHNIHRGYTFVKKLLQTAGEIDKTRTRDKHRIRRPRKPLVRRNDASPRRQLPRMDPGPAGGLLRPFGALRRRHQQDLRDGPRG